jgi:hypothetical protein
MGKRRSSRRRGEPNQVPWKLISTLMRCASQSVSNALRVDVGARKTYGIREDRPGMRRAASHDHVTSRNEVEMGAESSGAFRTFAVV